MKKNPILIPTGALSYTLVSVTVEILSSSFFFAHFAHAGLIQRLHGVFCFLHERTWLTQVVKF